MSAPTQNDEDLSLREMADHYFRSAYGLGLDALLAPVPGEGEAHSEAGPDLRGARFFREIEEARRADDPNLPLGPWERELKKADWPRVGNACLKMLAAKSKDLQLAGWVLESGLHMHCMTALMPGIVLIHTLCERYWDNLHPNIQDGDLEFRTNLIRWLDQKMPNLLAVCPLTRAGGDDGVQTLGDWRRATLPSEEGKSNKQPQEAFLTALAGTPTEYLLELDTDLRLGQEAIADLDRLLDALCGDESPGFSGLNRILQEIESLVGGELANRGQHLETQEQTEPDAPQTAPTQNTRPGANTPDTLQRREDAYAMLARAADFLMRADPHSPAPYLVRQAIAWGRMDTRALYQQLFLEQGGQINVFELLGLDPQSDKTE